MAQNDVKAQYEVYPYPERDPADETKRLIIGSPSWLPEMDHWLWGGARDWSVPLRILVAGGGTGDGLIQLAQMLTVARRGYEITYIDLSVAARAIAEKRAAIRGLKNIRFVTGSLLDAPEMGAFDYIDCCGVLHHLPDPQAGFNALADALAPGGGIGLMVYATLGRFGVYALQSAFGTLFKHLPPREKLAQARASFARIPDGHPFKRNPHLGDHKVGDAGFYDLLLHSSDRPYTITELLRALGDAGLELAGMPEPALYDPAELLPDGAELPPGLDTAGRMALAENLRGTLRTHIAYAVPHGARMPPPTGKPQAIPHLKDVDPRRLAQSLANKGYVRVTVGGDKVTVKLPKSAASLIAAIDGRRDLAAIQGGAGLDAIAFAAAWTPVEKALCRYGLLHYSTLLRGR